MLLIFWEISLLQYLEWFVCKSSSENPIWSAKRVAEKNKISYLTEALLKTNNTLCKDIHAQNVPMHSFVLKLATQ